MNFLKVKRTFLKSIGILKRLCNNFDKAILDIKLSTKRRNKHVLLEVVMDLNYFQIKCDFDDTFFHNFD